MQTSNKNFLNLLSFIAVVLVAALVLIKNLLPICGVVITGSFIKIIESIQEILVLLVIGISAYNYTKGRRKAFKIVLLISVIIFITGIILIWFR